MRYFIAQYYQLPKNKDGTPGKHSEQVKTDSRVRKNDLQTAGVILDYRDRKVVKCHFRNKDGSNEGRDFNTINEFYKGHYLNLISQLEAKYELLNSLDEVFAEIKADKEQEVSVDVPVSDEVSVDAK